MTRRRIKISFIALAMALLVGGVAYKSAHAGFGHGRKAAIMKRIVSAHIDEVLDDAKVNDGQRQRIHAARDRVFAAFEDHRKKTGGSLEQALTLFESDQVDANQISALRGAHEVERKALADVVTQALVEAHDTLSPQQRRVVTDHIRQFKRSHSE
ncbi:MAG: periplasmic heavy metal sensor [Myxococcales bacterium]|nr:periplasmic heavy metal sensor [Myxococcales bacterium]